MTLLGIISLAAVVINDAIVLIDHIRIEIEENGLKPQRAIIESAHRHLRPHSSHHCHNHRRLDSALYRRQTHVGTHGSSNYVWPGIRHVVNAGVCACVLCVVVWGEV